MIQSMTTMPPKTRAALYARVSTSDQDSDLQLAELRAVVTMRGWLIAGEFVDHGISGAKDKRPRLDAMRAAVADGQVDVVVFTALDRLGRSLPHLIMLFDEFHKAGVDVVSTKQPIDTTTPVGVLIFQILGAVAQFERELIRERVKAGVRKAMAAGKQVGRPQRWTQAQADRARELRSAGRSWRETSMAIGLPVRTIRRALGAVAKPRSS
jgi:DNA invertase Pin-like site-specific DNA recombinase